MYIFPAQILFKNVLDSKNVSSRGLLPKSYVTATKADLNLVERRYVHICRSQAAQRFFKKGNTNTNNAIRTGCRTEG